ncbi:uncharacterized protein K02A2.6-like [Lineus longissimus]|uniref:uncharacterized protein K02A2.6-like n=1 Tax=Lineus longissimus TaxID=88925 RepID=UPI00315D5A95
MGELNETYERYLFNKRDQKADETIEAFMAGIRTLIKTCNYHRDSVSSILRDRVVLGINDKETQKLLLRERNLTLEGCVNICKAAENATIQGKALSSDSANAAVSIKRVKDGRRPKKPSTATSSNSDSVSSKKVSTRDCKFCGRSHPMVKEKCPAWGKTCDNCHGQNHFSAKCRKPKVRAVSHSHAESSSGSDDEYYLQNVTSRRRGSSTLTAKMAVNGCHLHFQLDSGAEVNTLCQRFVKKDQVVSSSKKLIMWNGAKVKPKGEATLSLKNVRTGEVQPVDFVVVPNNLSCLLGINTIRKMGLITVNKDRFIAKVETETTESKLGDLGEARLHVNHDVKPRVLPCRNVPIALKEDVKKELDRLVDLGVLEPVSEPTEWVSQMAVVRKSNGRLRICLDPQPLNEALMREHYKLPTLDDVLPMLSEAKVFSKVDVKNAFWHVRLDEESSLLCAMITPFGRFKWRRLPFGLKVSSEIFQKRLTEALSGLEGVFTIADDIAVAGCGTSKSEALQDNDAKLEKLYERCDDRHIVLNDDKKEIGKTEMTFHGHRFTDDRVKPDESKIEAIRSMPAPTDVAWVKRFCGMVQYMSRFLPNLANDLGPIRDLTKKETEWDWSAACDQAFRTVKEKLTVAPVLAYFDSKKEVKVQTDSSKDGIGAVLLSGGRPVEYASRSLSNAQRSWAQIEEELLSVCFGLERFDQYTYGTKVIVENDHKPLAAILKKPLSQAPKRLQALLIRLHRYDVEFHFLKGTELVIADTLSRAFLESEAEERPRIMNIEYFPRVSDARLEEVRQATSTDPTMKTLVSLIIDGWPDTKQETPHEARPYFDIRDTLSYEAGIVLKAEAIVVPAELRADMKARLHAAHLGYNSMIRRARGLVFWPGLTQDIKQIVDNCEPCQELRARSPKEPLIPQEDGHGPWDKVASDIFEIAGRQHLVMVDFYSNFIEVDYLPNITSAQVISVMKKHFARYGIPRILHTDPGSQLTSGEFRKFTKDYGIIHVESSPGHHSANGKAEAAVKVAKHLLIKAKKTKTDPYIALLELRNTPREDTGLSPAQMLFGHGTRSVIPNACAMQQSGESDVCSEGREKRKAAMKRSHDKKATELSKLSSGQSVYFEHKDKERWILGKVIDVLGERTYLVKGKNGGIYRRNRVQMRSTALEVPEHTPSAPPPHAPLLPEKPVLNKGAVPQVNASSPPSAGHVNPSVRVDVPDASSSVDIQADAGGGSNAVVPNLAESPPPTLRRSSRMTSEPPYLRDFVRPKSGK